MGQFGNDGPLEMEATDRGSSEPADLAIKVSELSQTLVQKWLTADFSAKRLLLEIVFLNFKLDGVSLCYKTKKPFDVLAKGLPVPLNRGDSTPIELFVRGLVGLVLFLVKNGGIYGAISVSQLSFMSPAAVVTKPQESK